MSFSPCRRLIDAALAREKWFSFAFTSAGILPKKTRRQASSFGVFRRFWAVRNLPSPVGAAGEYPAPLPDDSGAGYFGSQSVFTGISKYPAISAFCRSPRNYRRTYQGVTQERFDEIGRERAQTTQRASRWAAGEVSRPGGPQPTSSAGAAFCGAGCAAPRPHIWAEQQLSPATT